VVALAGWGQRDLSLVRGESDLRSGHIAAQAVVLIHNPTLIDTSSRGPAAHKLVSVGPAFHN
jgi:hypothetical protein